MTPPAAGWPAVQDSTRTRPGGARPLTPGAVLCYGFEGRVQLLRGTGWARLFADDPDRPLPLAERVPVRTDTIFDLASLTKLLTAVAVLQQVDAGRVDLDAPVASYLPSFARHSPDSPYDKGGISVRQLLTHTSGLPAFLPLWRDQPDPASRVAAALTADLVSPAGAAYRYSDLNLITLGVLAAEVGGRELPALVADGITGPLGMTDTGYGPATGLRPRIAATEWQSDPPRGLVWGEVHDENAWSMGGVAGHAGLFGTAEDLAVLAQTVIDGGVHNSHRLLSAESTRLLTTDANTAFPGHAHGLGFELDQPWYMGGLSSARTAGHTGFTGTSLVIDLATGAYAILLTNRVHPNRTGGSLNPLRVAVTDGLKALVRREST